MKRRQASVALLRKQDQSVDTFLHDLVKTDEGVVSPRVFTDPEVSRLELERVFARSWLYVAHESEIPDAGDFVSRYMGEDPVVVWRGQDSKVRVFLNVCRHRGRRVCGEDMGKATHFRCPYHGWTYNNCGELISVPFFEGYQGKLDRASFGLYQAPRVDSYQGLIFAHWEASGESLSDYLGEIKWVLDILFGRTDGVHVLGAPMRWEAEANWKLAAANFAGDGIHVSFTHGFGAALGIENEVRKSSRRQSYELNTKNAHAAALQGLEDETYLALPKELWPEIKRHLAEDQLEVMKHLVGTIGNVFPNLSFLTNGKHLGVEWGGPEDRLISFLTLRQWQPKGAGKMEVWSWCFVDKNAPEWWKETSRECYLRAFGMAGMFEQDDMENWVDITQSLRGPIARQLWLQYKMGLGGVLSKKKPQVGPLHRSTPGEDNERAFYRHWQRLMMQA